MMIYQRRNKKNLKKTTLAIIIIIIIVILLTFFKIDFTQNIFKWFSYPILKTKDFVVRPFSGTFGYFKSKKDLEIENKNLENKISKLENDLLKTKLVEIDNIDLRKLLDRGTENKKLVLGYILAKPPFSPYDTLIIDIGKDKVQVGNKVFSQGVYLGEIVEVGHKTSIVRLVSSSSVRTVVLIDGVIQAEALGQGGGTLSITLPKSEEVEVGSVISIPGIMPILLGVISQIESTDVNSFNTAYFNLPVNFHKLRLVEIEI